jgi:hypothetical protein
VLILAKTMTHNASRPSSTDALASECSQVAGLGQTWEDHRS